MINSSYCSRIQKIILGPRLRKLAFQSSRVITSEQLAIIKSMVNLESLILRTNKFPAICEETKKSACSLLTELALSSSNAEEKSHLYQVALLFKNGKCMKI